ncbi:hypothetical protein DIPPA_02130 [Diplonema papillatum]|nr:hypothetical protein DIPPA_02130 [Diplonema papillatum]
MQDEIYRLYVQKVGKEPEGEIEGMIRGLTVKEVARIWSMMGDGGDFIESLQRVVKLKISKISGDGEFSGEGMDLDAMIKHLNEQKVKKLQDEEDAKVRRAEAATRREEERAKQKIVDQEQKEARERERVATEAAEAARKDAEAKAGEAARAKQQAAERAAASEQNEADDVMREAQAELKRLEEQAAEAERLKKVAEEKAAVEKADADRREAEQIEARKRDREEQEAAEREEEERNRREKLEEEEESEEPVEEVIIVSLQDVTEPLGLDCLAGAGRVRIIDVSGACARANVKSASVLLRIDGKVVDSQESLIESVKALRASGKMEFELVVQPPSSVSEEDKEILRQYNNQKEEISQWMDMVKKCEVVRIEMKVLQALDLLDKGSNKPFCEVKLREVQNGAVMSGHKTPQKVVTTVAQCKAADGRLTNAVWDELFKFDVPKGDAVRVSIFGKKTLTKEYLGKVDLILPELLEELCAGPIIARWPITGQEEGRGPVGGELELALNLVSCDGDTGGFPQA